MSESAVIHPTSRFVRPMALLSAAVGLIGLIKYLGIAIPAGFADSPYFFLAFLVVPFFLAAAIAPRFPRTGAVVLLLFGALYSWLMILQLVQGIEPFWGDYLLVFVGLPLCLAGLVLAFRVLIRR